ncbi:MAG: hypothetical protein QW794_02870 [Thermosphaera sp.]
MAAGAVVKLFVLLATYAIFVIILLPVRARIGVIITQINPDYQPNPQELEILTTFDDALYLLIWAGFFAIIAAIVIQIFRETTEGREYRVGWI